MTDDELFAIVINLRLQIWPNYKGHLGGKRTFENWTVFAFNHGTVTNVDLRVAIAEMFHKVSTT